MAKKKSDEDKLAFLPHLLALFTWIIGPIITLIIGEGALKEHSKKALNWQISLTIYMIVSIILIIVLVGILLVVVLSILNLVFIIMAIVKAADGQVWDYPMTIKFLK